MKLIEREAMLDEDKKLTTVFQLKRPGLAKLKSLGQMISREQLRSNYVHHDVQLVRLLNLLQGLEMVSNVVTENELQCLEVYKTDPRFSECLTLRPDAVATLTVRGHQFLTAIEFEQHQKALSRWKDKLASYHLASSIEVVLYLCSTEALMKSLMEIDRDCLKGQESKVFFASSENLSELILTNATGKELRVF